MPKIFCPECGYKHEFMDKRPKFCTECGYGFTSTAKRVPQEIPQDEPDDLDETDYNVPQFDTSDLNIGLRPVITIGQAIANPSPDLNYTRPSAGKKGLKMLQQEVAIRKGKQIGK